MTLEQIKKLIEKLINKKLCCRGGGGVSIIELDSDTPDIAQEGIQVLNTGEVYIVDGAGDTYLLLANIPEVDFDGDDFNVVTVDDMQNISLKEERIAELTENKLNFELSDTFQNISVDTTKRIVEVTEDEENGGNRTLYFHGGDVLFRLTTTEVALPLPLLPNLFSKSNLFNHADWSASNIALDDPATTIMTGPFGEDTAWTSRSFSSGGNFYRNGITEENLSYTISIYAKAGDLDVLDIFTFQGRSKYDLTAGTVFGNDLPAAIEDVGDGWFRCSLTYPNSNASTFIAFTPQGATGIGESIYLANAQLNLGTVATTYVNNV